MDERGRARRGSGAERHEEVVRAAAAVFAERGYTNGSLAEVAERVGITRAGVLHHVGSKEQLLVEVLEHRDREAVRDLEGGRLPSGVALFRYLMGTAETTAADPGLAQGYTVVMGEAVTAGHPAHAWAVERQRFWRAHVADAVQRLGEGVPRATAERAASAILGVMDGLQAQWLLDPGAVDLPEATRFGIEVILAGVVFESRREQVDAGDDAPPG
ncbi:TetR/AcrR family transcriptional regulator [Cellulomonas sp. SLBN-39]|uniref:TetR/AcrR family transcriptional regulator n=1 Tax=Cellulomonas sp. SLBN-39 TaxID=2768446 RepID=UPI00114F52D4|nr:TetR/AcrR family transcriptional regulator [Cellulomonas sp. SLBN-39]TQL01770.1 TetR family transcriptional regulator [Cellulomonas sp. SLBN-39]